MATMMPHPSTERVDVCVCTYRRHGIVETIASVARQRLPPSIDLRLVVVDNDAVTSAADQVEAARSLGLPITFVHAPQRNISIARNACIDAATARWIAFIDDDEIAAPDWIAALLAARDGVEVVFGRSRAVIQGRAPRWMADGEFHHNTIRPRDGAFNGYTCNVLLDRDFLVRRGLRFQLEPGRTGGEDTIFFDDLRRAGGRVCYAPAAVVTEAIPRHRATLGWLARRRYRSGQIHYHMRRRNAETSLRDLPMAAAKIAWCYALAGVTLFVPRRSVAAFLRGTLHLGYLSSALGAATYVEYGESGSGADTHTSHRSPPSSPTAHSRPVR